MKKKFVLPASGGKLKHIHRLGNGSCSGLLSAAGRWQTMQPSLKYSAA